MEDSATHVFSGLECPHVVRIFGQIKDKRQNYSPTTLFYLYAIEHLCLYKCFLNMVWQNFI